MKKRAELTWRAQRNQSAELAGFRSRSKRIQTADKLSESDLGQAKTYFRRNVRIRSVVGKWQLQAFSTAEREKKKCNILVLLKLKINAFAPIHHCTFAFKYRSTERYGEIIHKQTRNARNFMASGTLYFQHCEYYRSLASKGRLSQTRCVRKW